MKTGMAILLGVGAAIAGAYWWLSREPAYHEGQQIQGGIVVLQVRYDATTRRWLYTIQYPEGGVETLTRQQLDSVLAQTR